MNPQRPGPPRRGSGLSPAGSPRTPTTPMRSITAPLMKRPQSTGSSFLDPLPYLTTQRSSSLFTDKFALPVDPAAWGTKLGIDEKEPDDDLHNPDPQRDRTKDSGVTLLNPRGLANVGCLTIVVVGLITLFAGYPIITYFTTDKLSTLGAFNIGGTNSSGQVPEMPGKWGLIDSDTPKELYTITPFTASGSDWSLVFSDEFNVDGRTFYPGEDPYWEAVDLHYWGTNNMEWYDPAAITTSGGSLRVTFSQKETHDLHYQGGMMSTWNKFCFTGGLIVTSVQLPGINNVMGFWPAVWTMGNLGRAGYGASLDGLWPYSYDACDVGTLKNQTTADHLPYNATVHGDDKYGGVLSYMPGQRLSRCTCQGESHPGPIHSSDGTYVGRAAPEIDIFEAQMTDGTGEVSQSGQFAPFDMHYDWNQADGLTIYNESITRMNGFRGNVYQEATSGVTKTNQNCYELAAEPCYSVYGFEYKPGYDDAYITWISDNKAAWTLSGKGVGANPLVEISARQIPAEPMYIIINLGMSENFGTVDLAHLTFPATMSVDYVRVYQPSDAINIGCDPDNFPTSAYINQYSEVYSNPNLTTWVDQAGQAWPKNSFNGDC